MIVTFNSEVFDCLKTVKNGKTATLYLSDGGSVVFDGVNDWGAFSIEGGDWSGPEPSREEQLETDVAELKEALDLLLSGVTQ